MNTFSIEPFFEEETGTVSYVVFDAKTRDAIVIDPVLDYEPQGSFTSTKSVERILSFLGGKGLTLRGTLETHAHADHLSAGRLLAKKTGAPLSIGSDIALVQRTFKRIYNLPDSIRTDGSQFDLLLEAGRGYRFGTIEVLPLATPGHTPACQSFLIGGAVFTGDALFTEDYGTGRTDFPDGSSVALYESVTKTLFSLPDETRVFVGHDYLPNGRAFRCESSVLLEKKKNVQLDETTTREEFVALRSERDRALKAPRLLFQAILVNVFGGRLPEAEENGVRYFKIPLNLRRGLDEVGLPEEPPEES